MKKAVRYGLTALLSLLILGYGVATRRTVPAKVMDTAAQPEAAAPTVWPLDGSQEISVYPMITLTGSQPIQNVKGSLLLGGKRIGGEWQIDGVIARFAPFQILEPGTTYCFRGELDGQAIETTFTTSQTPMPDQWIEVALGEEQKVYVWQQGKVQKTFSCSGGLPESPSLIGIYSIKDRGETFYSKRFSEGAKYWVRIQDQYLFHSVPRDSNDQIIQEELLKIGQPASHGCIRLYDEDAQWLYESLPKGTMVILHPSAPDLFMKNLLES